jgi:hypothetical protein
MLIKNIRIINNQENLKGLSNLGMGRSTAVFGKHCGENESTIHFIRKSEDKIKKGVKTSAPADAKI